MSYNLSAVYEANNTLQITSAVNTLSNGWLSGGIIIVIYIITLMVYHRNNLRVSSIAASLVTTYVSILMYVIGFIGLNVLIIPLILLFVSIFIYMFMD